VVLGARLAENGLAICFRCLASAMSSPHLACEGHALSALMLAFVIELFTIVGFASLSDRIGRAGLHLRGCRMSGPSRSFFVAPRSDLDAVASSARRGDGAMFGPQPPIAELFSNRSGALPASASLANWVRCCRRPRHSWRRRWWPLRSWCRWPATRAVLAALTAFASGAVRNL